MLKNINLLTQRLTNLSLGGIESYDIDNYFHKLLIQFLEFFCDCSTYYQID